MVAGKNLKSLIFEVTDIIAYSVKWQTRSSVNFYVFMCVVDACICVIGL